MDTLTTVADTVSQNTDMMYLTKEGIVITILGYGVVFVALVILFLVVAGFSNLLKRSTRKKLVASGKAEHGAEEQDISGDTMAAISMALHLHFTELHDIENTIITIKKVQRPYSPWSSKIYGLRHYPRK